MIGESRKKVAGSKELMRIRIRSKAKWSIRSE